jgi:hypothetical protein
MPAARLIARLLQGSVFAACVIGLPSSTYAQAIASADDERAQQLAQAGADRAQRLRDEAERLRNDAMRQADEAMQAIDLDDMNVLEFSSRELGGSREIVKNAPYSADAITETTQILADGNRIVHKSMTLLARDSVGRTRQEKKTERGRTVYIYDPVENRSFALRTAGKIAVPLPRPPTPPEPPAPPRSGSATPPPVPAAPAVVVQPGRVVVRKVVHADGETGEDVHVEVIRIGRDEGTTTPEGRVGSFPPTPPIPPLPPLTLRGHVLSVPDVPRDKGVTETLGTRDFDGVKAEGKRTTHTIPAGAIGNEKPIAIVSERWFSPELNVVLLSRNVDPRSGETVYRLTNVKRGEPAADLFKIPADYKVRGEERLPGGR